MWARSLAYKGSLAVTRIPIRWSALIAGIRGESAVFKNGKQYLDSLGGMAGVQNEGSYEEGYFLLREAFVNPKAGEA